MFFSCRRELNYSTGLDKIVDAMTSSLVRDVEALRQHAKAVGSGDFVQFLSLIISVC